jgi:two-component system, chemotaxis family, protein-glutamate methylesterase/glutaminase
VRQSVSLRLPPFPNTAFDLVVMAASMGGLEALTQVLRPLPADFPAAIAIVMHRHRSSKGFLAQILARRTRLGIKDADQGEFLQPGLVYLAPPNYHLLVSRGGLLRLSDGEKVNFVRPAADLLFQSAAEHFKARVIGLVLTGWYKDGAKGAESIKAKGGLVIAQSPASAEAEAMPRAAIATGSVDKVIALNEIAATLRELVVPVK